ncbi:hypothetical protein NHX12_003693 [Muraenolepis orangiensis]|uniref:Uncharacterized protein n=1 Tax=Muraenolepis orangiensis TaxID=630683 RepID=A0A9Q0IEW5_9TELE|nr:hypothetical protein NHX12_003693 [Muraenolepis orangiensis]
MCYRFLPVQESSLQGSHRREERCGGGGTGRRWLVDQVEVAVMGPRRGATITAYSGRASSQPVQGPH